MNKVRLTVRAAAVLGGLVLGSFALTAPGATGAVPGGERAVSDTGAVPAAVTSGLRGISDHKGTGVPADVTDHGARPVATGHKIHGYDSSGGVGLDSIIGADNRVRVNPTTGFPARASVLITRTTNGVERQHCSGWMFGPSLVLTAGHCVYNQSSGWYSGQLRFYPGANGSSFPYGSCTASRLLSNTGWTQNGSADSDYGGAELNCTIGNSTGWYGAYWTTASLNGTSTTVQGYPGDKSQQQWLSNDQIRSSTSLRLYYDNDTVGGSSGSPVFTVRGSGSSGCSGRCSLAFHAYGAGAGGHNSGARLTESRFNMVLGWR